MPTYEYRCANCGHELEEFQSMSAKPLKKCPACGKNKLERLISGGGGVIFKGGGFYETDYRSDAYNKAAKADKEAASAKSESKADTKSDSKAESKPTKDAKQADKKTATKSEPKPGKSNTKPKS